jgi:putative membrane-bound dehydrogenase-like protein
MKPFLFLGAFLLLLAGTPASAAPPAAADSRLVVELIAQEPDIVTPTGVAVDSLGRIWVIENHTHQRQARYKGPPSDRIRIFEDFGPDGRARKITTFADGFKDSMGLTLGKNGSIFLATRSSIYLLRDDNGSGKATSQKVLAHLETKADYPHNGLSGFAIDAMGALHFGLGENFGLQYKLIGSDGTTLTGGGEGGSIYRMQPDGTELARIATGFWNPFHMAFDRWGRLFAVDNDPDARGPCRLLHIVPGGDYGYRFKYGRKGIHPFQSWNGELPGTLPMVAGTAEAPSGIVAYEADNLPAEFRGLLLVTSWGDHVIEQFQTTPRGASYGATKKIAVRGGEDFRPVGIAIAPDGSLVVSDWVDKSYPVHGKGRLWRIRAKNPPAEATPTRAALEKWETPALIDAVKHPSRDVRLAAVDLLAERGNVVWSLLADGRDPLERIHSLWATVAHSPNNCTNSINLALLDKSPEVRAAGAAQAFRLIPARALAIFAPDIMSHIVREDPSPVVRLAAIPTAARMNRTKAFQQLLFKMLANPDPFLMSAAIEGLATVHPSLLEEFGTFKDPRGRIGLLLTLRAEGTAVGQQELPKFLEDADPGVRRAAIQWVAEERLEKYAALLDKSASKAPASRAVFEAWVAAKEILTNPDAFKDPNKERSGDAFVAKVVEDVKQPAGLRALALKMLRADYPGLKLKTLLTLVDSPAPELKTEAIRALAWRAEPVAQEALLGLAGNGQLATALRGDAVMGLARSASANPAARKLLFQLLEQPELRADALRSLRGSLTPDAAKDLNAWWDRENPKLSPNPRDEVAELVLLAEGAPLEGKVKKGSISLKSPRPASLPDWRDFLAKGEGKGDPASGERVFFHTKGPGCYACHRIDGRGESIGPDLSHIGAAMKRDKLIESILEPSKEIAPAFVTWLVTTRDGKQHVGVLVEESADSTLTLADTLGKRTVLHIANIEDRVAQPTSIMPADLYAKMTRQEFLDLLAFLETRR